MEVIFYVVLRAAVDYSKRARERAGDYFVTRLSEHEWRRRGGEEKGMGDWTALLMRPDKR